MLNLSQQKRDDDVGSPVAVLPAVVCCFS